MAVKKRGIFSLPVSKHSVVSQRGGGIVEVLLAMVIIAVAAPFTYSMISETTQTMHNMAIANDMISLRDSVLNFVRANQDLWPDKAQINLSREELDVFSENIVAGVIDKYSVRNGIIVDVYLDFDFPFDEKRIAQIANNLGGDAAIVGMDGIAYGNSWAVTSPDFAQGTLVYKITRDVSDIDTSKFLHRGTSGEDGLNMMMRDLNMGGHNIYNIGGIVGQSMRANTVNSVFTSAEQINATNAYFSGGAKISGDNVKFGTLRVSGDINGFREIKARKLNGSSFTVDGRIVADRASINSSVNVGKDLVIKSDSLKSITGFAGMNIGVVYTPFVYTDEIIFFEDFGLTVSGELLVSSNVPLRLGAWSFPSTNVPLFKTLTLGRAPILAVPSNDAFAAILNNNWKTTYSSVSLGDGKEVPAPDPSITGKTK